MFMKFIMLPKNLEQKLSDSTKRVARELNEYLDREQVINLILQTVREYSGKKHDLRIRGVLSVQLGLQKKDNEKDIPGNVFYSYIVDEGKLYGGVRFYHSTGIGPRLLVCEEES